MKSVSATSCETVFIVDDDEAICAGICDLLESANLKTRQFSSAEEFLENWNPGMSGCLLLDVRLPGVSGMELHAKMRNLVSSFRSSS